MDLDDLLNIEGAKPGRPDTDILALKVGVLPNVDPSMYG
jgi:hypothetical protein